jgi:hypothetical protein
MTGAAGAAFMLELGLFTVEKEQKKIELVCFRGSFSWPKPASRRDDVSLHFFMTEVRLAALETFTLLFFMAEARHRGALYIHSCDCSISAQLARDGSNKPYKSYQDLNYVHKRKQKGIK